MILTSPLPKAAKKKKPSTVIEVDDIGFSYDHGKTETLKGISMAGAEEPSHRVDRSIRLWQVHPAALPQPNE